MQQGELCMQLKNVLHKNIKFSPQNWWNVKKTRKNKKLAKRKNGWKIYNKDRKVYIKKRKIL